MLKQRGTLCWWWRPPSGPRNHEMTPVADGLKLRSNMLVALSTHTTAHGSAGVDYKIITPKPGQSSGSSSLDISCPHPTKHVPPEEWPPSPCQGISEGCGGPRRKRLRATGLGR